MKKLNEDIKGGTMSLTQEDLILNINDLNELQQNSTVDFEKIWAHFCLLANASINDYKSIYELVGDERIKTDILQDYIEHLDKDDMLPQIKLNAIQMILDDNVFDVSDELKFYLCLDLIAAECGIPNHRAKDKNEKTADN